MKKSLIILPLLILFFGAFACKGSDTNHRQWSVKGSGVNVRSGPGVENPVLYQIQTGNLVAEIKRNPDKVKVGAWEGYWVQIEYLGRKGWVLSVFLKDVKEHRAEAKELEEKKEEFVETFQGDWIKGLDAQEASTIVELSIDQEKKIVFLATCFNSRTIEILSLEKDDKGFRLKLKDPVGEYKEANFARQDGKLILGKIIFKAKTKEDNARAEAQREEANCLVQ